MVPGTQNSNCINKALQERISFCVDSTAGGGVANNIYPTLVTATQLANEFKPY